MNNIKLFSHGHGIPMRTFTFPDGQPHIEVAEPPPSPVHVEAVLRSSEDVLNLLLLKEILDFNKIEVDQLYIKYMLGARMDRRIDYRHPATLQVMAGLIRNAGFRHISVLDPHSELTTDLLNARALLPYNAFAEVLKNRPSLDFTTLVIPDDGARERVDKLNYVENLGTVQGHKHRDSQTGKLSSFTVDGDVDGRSCLIVDDICDGGGTFTGLAKVLKEKGALKVDLFVTHGIFSKGLPLEGVDSIYTTTSLQEPGSCPPARVYKP